MKPFLLAIKMKEITLTRGYVALVDYEDFEELSKFKWYANTEGYAVRNKYAGFKTQQSIKMHRVILSLLKGDGKYVDHINGNVRDNRKSNLRICTQAENMKNQKIRSTNTSGFKGVSWNKQFKKFCAYIYTNGKRTHLGYYPSAELAYKAYCKASINQHGEFANFGNGCVILESKND